MRPKLKPIHDQVVVLMGATSGIGLETAMHMAAKGAKVAIIGRNQESLTEATDQVRSHVATHRMMRGRRDGQRQRTMMQQTQYGTPVVEGQATTAEMEDQVIGLEADITNFDQVKSIADQVVQRFGRIDTWVNLAAVGEWALFEDTNPDEFRQIIEVNLIGTAYGAMAAMPYLKQQNGGAIIFVSSVAGRVPIPYQSAYNASKHGILGLVDTLRLETQHTKTPISITSILPTSINTPLFNKARTKLGVEPQPIPPIYDTKMVARAITYAAQHPVRELVVGDAGYALTFMRRLAPTLTSAYLGATGFRQQRSKEPKSAQAPDNLYEHMTGYNQPAGEFTPRTRKFGPITWLSTHPKARMAIFGLALAGLGYLIGSRVVENRRRQDWRYRLTHGARDTVTTTGDMISGGIRNAGLFIAGLPLISSIVGKQQPVSRGLHMPAGLHMPQLRRQRSFFEQASDWLMDTFSFLPFVQSRKMTMMDRLTLAPQRKMASEMIGKRMPSSKEIKQFRQMVGERMPVGGSHETPRQKARQMAKDVVKKAGERVPSQKELMREREKLIKRAEKEAAKAEKLAATIPSAERNRRMAKRVVERHEKYIESEPVEG